MSSRTSAASGGSGEEEMPRVVVTRRRAIAFGLFVLTIIAFFYFVLPKLSNVGKTVHRIEGGDSWWIAVGVLLELASFGGYMVLFSAVFIRGHGRIGWVESYDITMAGLVATYRGTFPEAIASFEQALAALNAENSLPWRLPCRLVLARAYAGLGRTAEAERVLADANEHAGPHLALHQPMAIIAKAWVAAGRGADRTGVDLARAAADTAHRAGQYAIEAEALHHAARFGDRTVAARLGALAKRVDGMVARLYARHAAAVAGSDPQALDAVSADFENIGLLLSAADAAAQAVVLYERSGCNRHTTEASARALRLAAMCGGATTPAIRAAAKPLPISSREREIATLISEGLSNREIADKLTVSVRTVEGHIYHACTKLDISDREELAAIVARNGTA